MWEVLPVREITLDRLIKRIPFSTPTHLFVEYSLTELFAVAHHRAITPSIYATTYFALKSLGIFPKND